jgi:anti-sigma B factor antagonist
MSLSVQSRIVDNNAAVLALSGRFSALDGLILKDAVQSVLATGTHRCVFNLSELAYIDSFGLEQLLSACITTRDQGGDVRLVNPTERVRTLLQITRLDTVFQTFEDESTAIQSFAKTIGKSA